MASVVAADGLGAVTIARVAQAAGLQRTLVLHYFGDRAALEAAFVEEAVAAYGARMLWRDGPGGLPGRVARMFEPGAYEREEDLVVWTELVARAARDTDVRRRLHDLWTRRWLPDAEEQLRAEYPSAPDELVSGTAYALACLVEAHWAFHLQGLADPVHTRHARDAAEALLDRLASDRS